MSKNYIFVILLISVFLLSGCWNRRELNTMAIVQGMGIDQGENGQVKVSVQIAKPVKMQPSELNLSSQGRTVFDAIRNFISVSSRKPFFSHNQVIVFGEDQARSGLAPVIDMLERDPEMRVEVPVLVAKGKAEKILLIPGDIEALSAREMDQTLEAAKSLGKAKKVDLHELLQKINGVKFAAVAPKIEMFNKGDKQEFHISGMAVFKRDKLVGWLDEKETRGLLWVLGEVNSGILVLENPGGIKGKISMEIIRAGSQVKARLAEGKPVLEVDVTTETNIGEVVGPIPVENPAMMDMIQRLQDQVIQDEIQAAWHKAKELRADIFGIGSNLYQTDPKAWSLEKNRWDEVLTASDVKVQVKTKTRYSGDKLRPTIFRAE